MSAALPQPAGFMLGESTYYPDLLRIVRAGEQHRLSPKACAVLDLLIAAPGRVIARRDILDNVWKDSFPTDDVLTHAVTELRRALGDTPASPRVIETIPRAGYRLILTPQAIKQRPSRKSMVAIALTMALLFGTAVAVWLLATPNEPNSAAGDEPPDFSASPATEPDLPAATLGRARTIATASSLALWPDWSVDGQRVAFVLPNDSARGAGMIRVQDIGGGTIVEIPTPGGLRDASPLLGATGSFVIYQRFDDARCWVEKFDIVAGSSSRLVGDCYRGSGMDLSFDDRLLAYSSYVSQPGTPTNQRNVALFLFDLASGERRRFSFAERATRHDFNPRFAPDGRTLAFVRTGRRHDRFLMTQSLQSQRAQRIVTHSWITDLDWVDGQTLVVTAHRARRDVLELLDLARGHHRDLDATPAFAVRHANNQLIWTTGSLRTRIAVQDITSNEVGRATYSRQRDFHPAIAPDGRHLAFVSTRSGLAELLVKDLHTGEVRFLTNNPGAGPAHPSFHPGGASLVFIFTNDKGSAAWSADLASGELYPVVGGPGNVLRAQYDPEGLWLYFVSDRTGAWQLWRGAVDRAPEQLTEHGADHFHVSRDGGVYYTRPDTPGLFTLGRGAPVLNDFQGGPQSWIVDNRTLYYLDEENPEMLIQAGLDDLLDQRVRTATGFAENLSIDWARQRAYFERQGSISAELKVAPLLLAAP